MNALDEKNRTTVKEMTTYLRSENPGPASHSQILHLGRKTKTIADAIKKYGAKLEMLLFYCFADLKEGRWQ